MPRLAWVSSDHLFLLSSTVANSDERLQRQIRKLSLEQKLALSDWLSEAIRWERHSVNAHDQQQIEAPDIPVLPGREVVESRQSGKVTYRLEMVKCGKLTCRCASGHLHGPYWYAYQKQAGRLKSRYVGKDLSEPTE
jgi:hypothetical protein